jgi:Na+/H+ antiporter NhaD/arsenite permease-like protein
VRTVLLILFLLTYAAISARRLRLLPIGRPAAALVGAALCVALGALAGEHGLSIDEALHAVEPHTIALLFGMMVVAAALDVADFFSLAAQWLARRSLSPTALLVVVTFVSGLLSAVLVNDAVCLLATPLLVRVVLSARLPLRPFLFAICMGANAGSAMTFSGNPQNMLVAQLSHIPYASYLASAALPSLAALAVTALVLALMFRRVLRVVPAPATPVATALDRPLLVVGVAAVLGAIAANLAGAPLALTALVAASVCLVAARNQAETLLARVDWSVLLFFAGLFVLVASLQKTGYPVEWLAQVGAPSSSALTAVLLFGSQLVSNVPLILLLKPMIESAADPVLAWTLTALVSTLAGNLTLLGSVANVIVIERALGVLQGEKRDPAEAEIGFFSYLPVGLVVTLTSLGAALFVLWLSW